MEEDISDDADFTSADFQWTNEKLNLLITLFSEEKLLWDPASGHYHNREERQCAYVRLAQAVGCDGVF
jgi:hypothetical protein